MGNQNEERLGTSPILKLVFQMALPVMAAQVVNLLYGLVDRIYIGHIHHIGTSALAGVGMTNSIIILISAFALFVGGGGAPLASIALGRGDRKRAEKILGNGFSMLIFFAVVMMSLTLIFSRQILMLMGASGDVLKYGLEYFDSYVLGTFFVYVSTGLNTFVNAQGRPGISMFAVILGAGLNIILDPILIFVFHMGVRGAAVASVISQLCSCIWILRFLFSKKASLRIKLAAMKLDIKIIGSVCALGVSPFVMASTESIIGFVMNGTLTVFGDIYVSALTVLQSAVQMISVPLSGFIQGITPILSYNYGRGNKERVLQAIKICITFMFSVMFAAILLMIAFSRGIASLFTSNQELIDVVVRVAPAFLIGMSIFGLQRACQNTFVALGDAKISLFIALLRKIILLVPLTLILSRVMGVMGVFWSESIADATAAIICTVIFFIKLPKLLNYRPEKK